MKILISVILIIIIGFLSFLYYMGLFNSIEVTKTELGPFYFVYQQYIGDYKKVGTIVNNVYFDLLKQNILPLNYVGIYYDDPKIIKKAKLRSEAGCFIEEKNFKKLGIIKKKYKAKKIKKYTYLSAKFPFKNDLSVFFGVIKIYPLIQKYAKVKHYKLSYSIELYESPMVTENPTIEFLMPINTKITNKIHK